MRELRLKLLDNGSVIKRETSSGFTFENKASKVVLETDLQKEYFRSEILIADG